MPPTEDDPPARPNGRTVATLVIAVVVVLVAMGTVWIRATYGVWTILDAPTRLVLCHQPYTRFDDRPWTRAEVARHDAQADQALVIESTVGRLPVGLPEPDRFVAGAGYNGCGHLLLLHVDADAYVVYYKLGGP